MINKVSKNECSLCQACSEICPKSCIEYKDELYGFKYPVINKVNCINCNLCESVCPIINPLKLKESKKEIFAAKNLNDHIRKKSSSGGVFSAVAQKVLLEQGVVCGVAFNSNFDVIHKIITSKDELSALRGSKYVQSNINQSYKQIKIALLQNKKVLFSGCPCQVAGLKKFLKKDYDNLLTIDFICHGIPSQSLFNEYRSYLEKKYKSKIIDFKFRDKSKGWHYSSVRVCFENGKIYSKPITEDLYMRGFLTNIYLKPACHQCKFRNFKSGSDLTLADFWGAEIEVKDIDDNKGLSLVICNTSTALNIIEDFSDNVYIQKVDFDKAISYNQSLLYSSKENEFKKYFFEDREKYGFDKAFLKYCSEKKQDYIIRNIRKKLGILKKTLLKVK